MKKKNRNSKLKIYFSQFGTSKERNYIVENLSTLLSANVGVVDAFISIKKDLRSSYLRRVIDGIIFDVNNGVPLWRALEQSHLFNDSIISLIKIGEQSGRLSQNLIVVAQRNKKSRSFKSKMRSAMMYPLFVLGLTFIIGIGISWFILPKLSQVFGQLKIDLPLVTKVVIRFGELLGEYGFILVPALVVFVFLILFFLFVFKKTKHIGQALLLHVPGIGRLIREVEVARFSYLLGTLLAAGIPVGESLSSLSTSTTIKKYRKFYNFLEKTIIHGHSFRYAFSEYKKSEKIIPSPIQQMIVTGEYSGNLSNMLNKISEIYEEKIDSTTKNVSVLLEPILLVIIWVGVVGIALSVILPIYGLLSGVN